MKLNLFILASVAAVNTCGLPMPLDGCWPCTDVCDFDRCDPVNPACTGGVCSDLAVRRCIEGSTRAWRETICPLLAP